jgi:oligopeptide/dipeptide ABC transporter ATP-binding protein
MANSYAFSGGKTHQQLIDRLIGKSLASLTAYPNTALVKYDAKCLEWRPPFGIAGEMTGSATTLDHVDAASGVGAGPLLSVKDLAIGFRGSPANVVDGISFEVSRGRTLAVVGESGCGKSLTALALMGLLPPSAKIVRGSIEFQGKNLLGLSEKALAGIRGDSMAMIFQEPMTSLNPMFTAGDQIAEAVKRHRGAPQDEATARAVELLRLAGIPAPEQRIRAYPHELSGGMRQRVMIAMALANNPALLIADEPTTALDVTIQAQILALIGDLQRDTGAGMILITHDLGVVAEVADEVAIMYAGHIVEAGPVAAIFDDPQHPYTIGLMGSTPMFGKEKGRLAAIPGSVPGVENMPRGCRFVTRCPFAIARCAKERPPLTASGPTHSAACFLAPIEAMYARA